MANGRITLRDLMNTQNRIEDKIDAFRKEINKKFNDIDNRVSEVENWRSNLNGKIAFLSGAAMLIINVAWYFIKDIFKTR